METSEYLTNIFDHLLVAFDFQPLTFFLSSWYDYIIMQYNNHMLRGLLNHPFK